MKCPKCQHENPPESNFCLGCGARLGLTCASCGTLLPAGSRFCNRCGTPVTEDADGPARFASPESYTPKHLAEKILTSKSALEGERKQVTVLFADLKGSMELLADRDPEEARKILDPVLERMMEAVHRYEGTVNQVMGDGIMALFGAPLAHEDHAVRACYAALRMQESVKKYADEMRRSHAAVVKIRVGLNSGEVVVRAIGSDLRMDYTAVGQTTHLAARMEQLAEPGSILLSPATLELAEGHVAIKPLGPLPVKGLPEPVEVYELVGAGAVRSRLHAAAVRGLTRFVGRDSELDQLRQTLERAQAGHGQVVAVVGEPGVGKSRLFWEFTHSHRAHGWLILEAGPVSYGKTTAYLPVIELLKAYFHIEERDETRTIREKVTGKVLSLDRAWEPSLSALLSLLDVPVEDEAWERLDPPQRRQQTLDAVKRLLLRESQVQPLMLVFEDLHWIDAETQALLDSLVESLPTARLLLLANYRPEYQHRWGSKTYYRQLRIDPLPAESADDLLTSLLGTEQGLDSLRRTLIERTEGNPLFLEESVRTLVETKTLIGERGAYRLAHDATAIQVPATVQAILAARIDRLAPEDKWLLQAAAVIGKDVPFTLLLAVAELADEDLRRGLAHLQAAEFLYEASLFPELEYTFKHALTHEVAYGSLLQERRRHLHAEIVEAIEKLHPQRLAEYVERLGYHASRGDLWDKAVAYLRQAGAKALGWSTLREAAGHFEAALAALAHLPETRETLQQAVDLRFNLHDTLLPLAEYSRVRKCLNEAEAAAHVLGDQRRLGRAYAYMSHHLWLVGDNNLANDYGRRALTIASAAKNQPLEIVANLYLGQITHSLGDYRQAAELLGQIVGTLRGDHAPGRFGTFYAIISRAWSAYPLGELGQFADGIALAEEGLRIAEASQQPLNLLNVYLIAAYFATGRLHLLKGDFEIAASILKRALLLPQVGDLPQWLPMVASALGLAYARSAGPEALPLLEGAVHAYEARGIRAYEALWLVALAEGYLLTSRPEDALSQASRALEVSRRHHERGHEAWALRLLGEIASHHHGPDVATAEAHYGAAIALASELGMRPLVAHCHLGLGKLYRRTGKRREAQEHLTTATSMYREMGMTYWLGKAERQMGGLL